MTKRITKWEPDDFELETNTVWSFPDRGKWATHDAKWRGNWSPYIPRNIKLSEAPSMGKSIYDYDMACEGARAYVALTKEVIDSNEVR